MTPNFVSTKSAGLLAVGRAAERLLSLRREVGEFFSRLGAASLWLPPGGCGSPACEPFLAEIGRTHRGLFAGMAVVSRREPLRGFDPAARLEAFTLAEVVIVGDRLFCRRKYGEVRAQIGRFLGERLQGGWLRWSEAAAIDELDRPPKEEWVAGGGPRALTVACGRRHGDLYLKRRDIPGQSCCFGIGIERLFEAINRFPARLSA